MLLIPCFCLLLTIVSAASIDEHLPNKKHQNPRKLHNSVPAKKNSSNDLGKIEARPLGQVYKDAVSDGSESDSDTGSSSDSTTETEVDEQPKVKIAASKDYYSSTDDLYNLGNAPEGDHQQFYYKK